MSHNNDPLAGLLQVAGPREAVPAERARRVEAAVRVEWQDAVQKRVGRRRAAWIAASCLTSAALIALVLHAHVAQVGQEAATVPSPPRRPVAAAHVALPRDGSYFRANNEDRPPDRGMPRHMLASYTWEAR